MKILKKQEYSKQQITEKIKSEKFETPEELLDYYIKKEEEWVNTHGMLTKIIKYINEFINN